MKNENNEFDINEHELIKFLYIFGELIHYSEEESINNEDKFEDLDNNTDGLIDTLQQVINKIVQLVNSDIDNLKKEKRNHMPRTKLVAREYYRSQKDRFQNPATFAIVKRKKQRKSKKN